MRILPLVTATVLALALSAGAQAQTRNVTDPAAPRALETDGPVAVEWTDPAEFTEIRNSSNRWEARRGDWVRQLAGHLAESAGNQLAVGERLDVRFTDIRRAGDYEPWRGAQMDHVRIMRDIHWPRMTLEFSHFDATGNLLAQGERSLADPSYLSSSARARSHDPLRYEKAMIDRWLRQELGNAPAAVAAAEGTR